MNSTGPMYPSPVKSESRTSSGVQASKSLLLFIIRSFPVMKGDASKDSAAICGCCSLCTCSAMWCSGCDCAPDDGTKQTAAAARIRVGALLDMAVVRVAL